MSVDLARHEIVRAKVDKGGIKKIKTAYFRAITISYADLPFKYCRLMLTKIVSEYDQEMPQSQTADKPMVPQERATYPSRDTRKTNQAKQPSLSFPSR